VHAELALRTVQRRQLDVQPKLLPGGRRPGEQPLDRLRAGIQLPMLQVDQLTLHAVTDGAYLAVDGLAAVNRKAFDA